MVKIIIKFVSLLNMYKHSNEWADGYLNYRAAFLLKKWKCRTKIKSGLMENCSKTYKVVFIITGLLLYSSFAIDKLYRGTNLKLKEVGNCCKMYKFVYHPWTYTNIQINRDVLEFCKFVFINFKTKLITGPYSYISFWTKFCGTIISLDNIYKSTLSKSV